MKKRLIPLFAALAFPLRADPLPLVVSDAYVRTAPPGQTLTAAFATIANKGSQSCLLVAAQTPIAGRIEIHQHLHRDGMMSMRPVDAVEIAGGETVQFQPGGYHLMLFDVEAEFAQRQTVPMLLITENCGNTEVAAEVRDLRGH